MNYLPIFFLLSSFVCFYILDKSSSFLSKRNVQKKSSFSIKFSISELRSNIDILDSKEERLQLRRYIFYRQLGYLFIVLLIISMFIPR